MLSNNVVRRADVVNPSNFSKSTNCSPPKQWWANVFAKSASSLLSNQRTVCCTVQPLTLSPLPNGDRTGGDGNSRGAGGLASNGRGIGRGLRWIVPAGSGCAGRRFASALLEDFDRRRVTAAPAPTSTLFAAASLSAFISNFSSGPCAVRRCLCRCSCLSDCFDAGLFFKKNSEWFSPASLPGAHGSI